MFLAPYFAIRYFARRFFAGAAPEPEVKEPQTPGGGGAGDDGEWVHPGGGWQPVPLPRPAIPQAPSRQRIAAMVRVEAPMAITAAAAGVRLAFRAASVQELPQTEASVGGQLGSLLSTYAGVCVMCDDDRRERDEDLRERLLKQDELLVILGLL
jgi:hypothetical protein